MKTVTIFVKYPDKTNSYYTVCEAGKVNDMVSAAYDLLPHDGEITSVLIDDANHILIENETCKTRSGKLVLINKISGNVAFGRQLKERNGKLKPHGDLLTWHVTGVDYKFVRNQKSENDIVESIDRQIKFDTM